jgi:hypothetical protein
MHILKYFKPLSGAYEVNTLQYPIDPVFVSVAWIELSGEEGNIRNPSWTRGHVRLWISNI